MLVDVVIDTNVLVHATNPGTARFAASVAFLQALLSSSTALCVDIGFSLDQSSNRGLIAAEYLAKVTSQSLSAIILSQLAQSGRVKVLDLRISPQHRRRWPPPSPARSTAPRGADPSRDRASVLVAGSRPARRSG